jgi:hypothetical protein
MVDPKARADDLRWALEIDEIKAIFSTIGGDESIRILPYIDLDVIGKHPKVMWRRGELKIRHRDVPVRNSSFSGRFCRPEVPPDIPGFTASLSLRDSANCYLRPCGYHPTGTLT